MNKYIPIDPGIIEAAIISQIPNDEPVVITDDGEKRPLDSFPFGLNPDDRPGDYVVISEDGNETMGKADFEARYKVYVPS